MAGEKFERGKQRIVNGESLGLYSRTFTRGYVPLVQLSPFPASSDQIADQVRAAFIPG